MRASMSQKSLIGGIFLFLFLLLAGNSNSEVEPVYAGWTVGNSWDDGSGTSYGTILRSTDSGKTWIRQGAGQIADVNMQGVFAVDPYTAWVVGVPDSGYATIYYTIDGGNTWERKGSSDPMAADYVPDVGLAKVHAAGDDVWAVGTGTILHTNDGGATWTNYIPDGYENSQLQGIYALDSNTVWATGGYDDSMILKTTDSGQTWTRQSGGDAQSAGYILGISAADADTAWAVGQTYIVLKTTDGGATWSRHPGFGGLGDTNEVYAVSTSIVWVAGDNGIYWTHDGGQSWEDSSDYGLLGSIAYSGISAVGAQKAWASYYHGGSQGVIAYIAYTTDGGTTWTKVEQLCDACEALPGLMNISFANPNYLITSLIEDVELLVDDGFLNKGQGNALIKKLEKVMDRLANDRNKSAMNAFNAFLNQVDAFVRGGVLSSGDGEDLSDQVNNIIELFSFTL